MTIVKVKRFLVTLIGFTILMIGIVMIVFPGPAFIIIPLGIIIEKGSHFIIPLGLAILGTEYVWANKMFEKMKRGVKKTFGK